jgi:polysaccharide export outer membrane protein
MRTAKLAALPLLFGLFCGFAAAQDQTTKPPAAGGAAAETTDPLKTAGDRPDPSKAGIVGAAAVASDYEIGPEDVITVWVLQQGNMTSAYMVATDGTINLPLIGVIKVAGKTKTQVENDIADRLKSGEIINDPNVTVNVSQANSKKVYVSGEGIAKVGVYPLAMPTRVSQLLAAMGGFREWANRTRILILREVGPGKPPEKHYYNDKEVSEGKKLEQDIFLKAGDHVYVK